MGTLYQVDCPSCGVSWEAAEGYGFAGVELAPMICRDCRAVVSVPVSRVEGMPLEPEPAFNACPRCAGRQLTALEFDIAEGSTAVQSEQRCPRCEDGRLHVEAAGIWD